MKHLHRYLAAAFYCCLLIIFFLAVTPETDELPEIAKVSDKLNHLAAFIVLSLLIDLSYPNRSALWKSTFLISYGLMIECTQYFLPYREFSILDLAVDGLGIMLYFSLKPLMSRAYQKITTGAP